MVNCAPVSADPGFHNPMTKKKRGQKAPVISKAQAIEEATARVSDLVEVAPGRWCYHVWSDLEDAWIPAMRSDQHAEARRKRVSTIAALAVSKLVRDGSAAEDSELTWEIVGLAYGPENTGSVRERVDRILQELTPAVSRH